MNHCCSGSRPFSTHKRRCRLFIQKIINSFEIANKKAIAEELKLYTKLLTVTDPNILNDRYICAYSVQKNYSDIIEKNRYVSKTLLKR